MHVGGDTSTSQYHGGLFESLMQPFAAVLYRVIVNDSNPSDQICPGTSRSFVFAVGSGKT